jgi:hypothetical protein
MAGNAALRRSSMAPNISVDVYILSARDLDKREQDAFRRGVERGRFEASMEAGKERVAINCKHWRSGVCDHCGAQTQGCEVSAEYKCPHFEIRR